MKNEIRVSAFDPWHEIQHYQQSIMQQGQYGATAIFIGTMRDFNQGKRIQSMYLEHYAGMTEKHLDLICTAACQQWDLVDVLLLHRVGMVEVAEPIVLICVWSAHRAQAFEACRFIIEDLKAKAPFWKQESTVQGKHWVTDNTHG